MRVGQGELGARQWHRGLVDAATLGDETVTALFIEDPDLHDHLAKGIQVVFDDLGMAVICGIRSWIGSVTSSLAPITRQILPPMSH